MITGKLFKCWTWFLTHRLRSQKLTKYACVCMLHLSLTIFLYKCYNEFMSTYTTKKCIFFSNPYFLLLKARSKEDVYKRQTLCVCVWGGVYKNSVVFLDNGLDKFVGFS